MNSKLPELKPVSSKNIKATAHEDKTLYVQFYSGDIWSYTPVPAAVHAEMLKAPSIGSYFHKWIRSNSAYKGERVQGGKTPGPGSAA